MVTEEILQISLDNWMKIGAMEDNGLKLRRFEAVVGIQDTRI